LCRQVDTLARTGPADALPEEQSPMSNDSSAPSSSDPTPKPPLLGRDRLARMVVVGSFLTLFLLAGVLVSFASHGGGSDSAAEAAEKCFNAILPVLASWVGTVLAFYFSATSQDSANKILGDTFNKVSGVTPPSDERVSTRMIPTPKIIGTIDLGKDRPEQVTIGDLRRGFEKTESRPAITRLFFLERDVFKFVLHSSTLYAFIVKTGASDDGTFADLLKDQDTAYQISKLVVFVSTNATLGQTKTALEGVDGAQDVVVTPTGNGTESMLGWISNVGLTKALTVK
jgi:hypothetical protein